MENLEREWTSLTDGVANMEKMHEQYLSRLAEVNKLQAGCLKAVQQHNKLLGQMRDDVARAEKAASPDERASLDVKKAELVDMRSRVRHMQQELPVQDNGFYLRTILGRTINLSLLSNDARYKYKQEYESFKKKVTMAVLLTVFLSYLFPLRVMDSIGNFLMVWYYCTLTIRESILVINGSKIKGWWVAHHYLSCALCGITLTWRDGGCYRDFRAQFLVFVTYICLVQLLQTQYQSGCLRRLHSLGQGHEMDVTVEGFQSWMFKGLTFLLPFLVAGYIFQLYNAYTLYTLYTDCSDEWQVIWLSATFTVIAIGNIATTSLVIVKKLKQSRSYTAIKDAARKYSRRLTLAPKADKQKGEKKEE